MSMRNPRGGTECVAKLSCPVCGLVLEDRGTGAACGKGHSFDYAKSGYLNLTLSGGGRPRIGDSPEMVRARAALLSRGFLEPVADAVAQAAEPSGEVPNSVAELGSGTGYYLDRVCRGLSTSPKGTACGVGVDLSVAASAHAARAFPELCFVVADVERRVPLLDRGVGVLLSVFSPRPALECARVLHPGGTLVAAFATERHLQALRRAHGLLSVHPDKLQRLSTRLGRWFALLDTQTVEYEVTLEPDDVANAIAMGPSARHRPEGDIERRPIEDRFSVTVARFERRRDAQLATVAPVSS